MIEIPARFAGNLPSTRNRGRRNRSPPRDGRAQRGWPKMFAITGDGCVTRLRSASAASIHASKSRLTMAESRPDLQPLIGELLTVNAWLWRALYRAPTRPSPISMYRSSQASCSLKRRIRKPISNRSSRMAPIVLRCASASQQMRKRPETAPRRASAKPSSA